MTAILLAEFARAQQLTAAARGAAVRNCRVVDAVTPFPIEDLHEFVRPPSSRIRPVMLIAGFAVAALACWTEYYTATLDYPYNSGGRPLNSWPTFMLVPFALGILGATIAGLTTFLVECGLPRLHHPLFAVAGFERASQDRFVLALARPEKSDEAQRTIDWLRQTGALAVREVEA